MKQLRLINLGMVVILIIAALATFDSAFASEPPPTDPEGLVIKKTVNTDVKGSWDWDIEKSASVGSLVLSTGQSATIDYEVTLTATPVRSEFHVWGTVEVRNTTASEITITSITDELSDGTVVDVICSGGFSFALPAGFTKVCTYDVTLDHSVTSNTATVVSSIGTASVNKAVTFGTPGDSIDECVQVSDSQVAGGFGTVCAGDAPKTFSYSKTVGPYAVCGLYEVANIASFVAIDTGAKGSDTVKIPVDVPCKGGCTLTPGYWKTHSSFGPAPYDETWAQIGESSSFYFSGKSYYNVLWTNPSGGNAYYILAHAYIAAKLNQLNGANFTAAQAAFDAATLLFNNPANTPASVGALRGGARNVWINLASTLDNYNNGLIGPGHCSE